MTQFFPTDLTSTPSALLTDLPPLGMDAGSLAIDFRQYFSHTLGRERHGTPPHCFNTALALTLRDRLVERWKATDAAYDASGSK
ncbi:MAG: hypothetical protein Q8N45_07385, partial [Anaerolineales bacterium]|nr:hypothetical protein [Anaerolineales bacterium]